MKSLQTIQKTFRVFQILTKIAMIFSYVWAGLATLGLLCAFVWYGSGTVAGPDTGLLYTLTETGGLKEMTAVLCTDAVSALLSAILLTFAYLYLKAEQADGTPFTRRGAEQIRRLGVRTIVLSIVNAALTEAVFVASELPAYANADRGNFSGVTLGIALILASLIFRYGAELEERHAQTQAET
ncbi:MAG: hypothetical protein ACI4P4_05200 [Faecousia sp.]